MKALRFFYLVAVALSVAVITLAGRPAKAQPPFYETPPRMIAAGSVHQDSKFSNSWNMYLGKPGSMTCVWNASRNWYEITIPGVSYFYPNFVTLVTAIGAESNMPPIGSYTVAGAVISSVDNKLLVSLTDPKGNRVQGAFSFVVFQYPSPIP